MKISMGKTQQFVIFHAVTLIMNRVVLCLWGRGKVRERLLQYWIKYFVKSKKSKQNGQERKALISTLVWLLTITRFTFERETIHYIMFQSLYTWSLYTWFIKILKLFGNSWCKNYFTCSNQTNTKMIQSSKILCAELQILNVLQARISKLCSFNEKDKKYSWL